MKTKVLAVIFVACFCKDAMAQSGRAAVYVQASMDDLQGQRLEYAIKEQIRVSASMRLADQASDSGFQVRVTSIDPDNNGIRTVYSSVITLTNFSGGFPYYLNSFVGSCGRQVIDQCANSIVASTDKEVSEIRAALAAQMKK